MPSYRVRVSETVRVASVYRVEAAVACWDDGYEGESGGRFDDYDWHGDPVPQVLMTEVEGGEDDA